MIAFLHALILLASVIPTAMAETGVQTEGATIRLIAEAPDEAGRVRGAVVLDLAPGWKTYWLDPGESGLAPRLDFSASQGVGTPRLTFPAPERIVTEGERLNGYDRPVAVAFETTAHEDARLVLSLQVGLCRTLCVPVAAVLERDLSEPLSTADAMAIDRAFLALPQSAGAAKGRIEGDILLVEAPSDIDGADDLFVSAPSPWRFGAPTRQGALWQVPIRERPRDGSPPDAALDAVFVAGHRAFSLTIDLP